METKYIIAATLIKGIGNSFIRRNISYARSSSNLREFLTLSAAKCELDVNIESYVKHSETIIQECQNKGYQVIDITSDEYPETLMAINDAPAVIYLKGNASLLKNTIAIIGTRHSTLLGNRIAERLGAYFSDKYAICNGLVEGIDMHSIYVNGKILPNVVGIISGGLNYNETCSKAHSKIIEDVLNAGGLIISEFPPKQKENQYSGSKVCRIQAGLSKGLILVQSSIGGGSKYTIKAFSKLGRPLGVINFAANEEFQSDAFSANRLIINKGLDGVAEFIGQRTLQGLNIEAIICIESLKDYDDFCESISLCNYNNSLW